MMFWNSLTGVLGFSGITDVTVWQDIVISALLIPIVILLINRLWVWVNSIRPTQLLLKGFPEKGFFVFHSKMSGAYDDWRYNPNQKYITKYSNPLPSNSANLKEQHKKNIDPVVSTAEAECLADVYSVMGNAGKASNIRIGDLINNWNVWSAPMVAIGFNPKTNKLIQKCDPIYFELSSNNEELIKRAGVKIVYDSVVPNDAGIIQKTYLKDRDFPVLILAGLGIEGTRSSGHIFSKYFVDLGKLYGSDPFCVFLKGRIDEGESAATIDKIYPLPKWWRIIFFPFTYYKFTMKGWFNSTEKQKTKDA